MEGKQIIVVGAMALFTIGLSLIGAAPVAAQGSCQPVDDAMKKVFTTPTHKSVKDLLGMTNVLSAFENCARSGARLP